MAGCGLTITTISLIYPPLRNLRIIDIASCQPLTRFGWLASHYHPAMQQNYKHSGAARSWSLAPAAATMRLEYFAIGCGRFHD